eukprot:symbB.v1.2.010902.t2/scaffold720.1/size169259/13
MFWDGFTWQKDETFKVMNSEASALEQQGIRPLWPDCPPPAPARDEKMPWLLCHGEKKLIQDLEVCDKISRHLATSTTLTCSIFSPPAMLGFAFSARAWLRFAGILVAGFAYLLQGHRSLSSRAASYVKPGSWAVVLGGSEGIGEAWAFQLGHIGMNLVLVARREKPLEDVKQAILKVKPDIEVRSLLSVTGKNLPSFSRSQVDVFQQDLSQLNASRFSEMLEGRDVRLLIHNAAHVGKGSFLDSELGTSMPSIDVNVKSVLTAAYVFGNDLKERGAAGGIVLMSSLAGETGSPYVANYAATKAYITTLAKGLYEEWWSKGIDALACVAGATITPSYLSSFSEKGARVSWIEQEPFEVVSECLANVGRTSAVTTGALNKVAAAILTRLLPSSFATQFLGQQAKSMLGL